MLTVDPYTVAPGSILDQLFEVKVFAVQQITLLNSAIKFDVIHPDGVVSGVQFDRDGSQVGAQLASQVYENWFEQEGKE